MRGLLRVPVLNRTVGGGLVTLYIVGRKTGRRFSVPVAYTRHKGDLLIDNRNFASFNRIRLDTNGAPDVGDLQLAWAADATAVRLTPR